MAWSRVAKIHRRLEKQIMESINFLFRLNQRQSDTAKGYMYIFTSSHLANRLGRGVLFVPKRLELSLNIFLVLINISYFSFSSCKKISLFLVPSFFNIIFLVFFILNFSPKNYFKTYV